MTNEGACNVLENCAFYLKDGTKYMKPEHEQQFRQAYEMAIEALKAQPEDYTELKREPKTGYISIDDVMSVFDDFMCGEVDEEGTETFLEMLKDKAESEEV